MANSINDLNVVNSIEDSDLLVALQHDKYISDKYNTCALSGQSLFSMLVEKVLDMQNLNSMAHMQSDEFSPYDHNHDSLYNNLSCEFYYASDKTYSKFSSRFVFKNTIPDNEAISVGNMFIDGTLVPVEIPANAVTDVQRIKFTAVEPMVGTLKFVASATIESNSTIQHKLDDFDGWLYPDGSTFDLSDFVLSNELKRLYGNADNVTFTLPNVNDFLKMNGTNQKISSSAIGAGDGKNVLLKHSHEMDASCKAVAHVVLRLPGNPDFGDGGTLHGGNGIVNVKSSDGKWIKYGENTYTFGNFINELGLDNHKSGKVYSMNIHDVDRALQVIDSNNGTNLYSTFINRNVLKLNPIDAINIEATVNMTSQPTISQVEVGGETIPSHVVLPVMIYVGQRRRDII